MSRFVDCFVVYEEHERTWTDEDGLEQQESYTVAVPIRSLDVIYANIAAAIGYGTNGMQDVTADGMYNAAIVKDRISTMPDIPGLAIWHAGHIGIYIGNGEVIEAMGTNYGVVKTQLSERSWTAWLEIPYINYLGLD